MNILFLGAYENNGRRYENDSSIGDTGDTASPLIAPLFFLFLFFLLRVQLQHALSTSRLASSREL